MALRVGYLEPKAPVVVDEEQLRSVVAELCPDASKEDRETEITSYAGIMRFDRIPNLHTAAATEYLEGLSGLLNEKLSPATEVTPARILESALRYQQRAESSRASAASATLGGAAPDSGDEAELPTFKVLHDVKEKEGGSPARRALTPEFEARAAPPHRGASPCGASAVGTGGAGPRLSRATPLPHRPRGGAAPAFAARGGGGRRLAPRGSAADEMRLSPPTAGEPAVPPRGGRRRMRRTSSAPALAPPSALPPSDHLAAPPWRRCRHPVRS